MTDTQTPARQGTTLAFAYVTTLFFAWGFATSLIDPLIAAVKGVFDLNYTEALLTQFAWFTAYGIVSLPAAAVLARLGYAKSIVGALAVMVVGALIVPLSTLADFYPGVLAALAEVSLARTVQMKPPSTAKNTARPMKMASMLRSVAARAVSSSTTGAAASTTAAEDATEAA